MNAQQHHPLLFEMIRSFTTLARHLNLSHAVAELNSTRQTVRRHIAQLEEARGEALFVVKDRRYELTEAGLSALPDALDMQARASAWLRGQTGANNNMQYLTAQEGEWDFFQQQQPVGQIWEYDDPLMRETFRAWAMSAGQIEHPAFTHVRPYLIVYRHTAAGWICVEFGEESFYVQWFGLAMARSSIGRPLGRMPGGEDFARMLDQPFHDVEASQSARLDHIFTQVPRMESVGLEPIAYRRLMLGGRFPDNSLAVLSLVTPTVEIDVPDLDPARLARVENFASVVFDAGEAKYERFNVN
ncbi:MAG: LysR family transcriptional regulator [Pseudomonadota bacterium]